MGMELLNIISLFLVPRRSTGIVLSLVCSTNLIWQETETIIMVGMSKMQKQLYKKLLLRDLDAFTGNNSGKNTAATATKAKVSGYQFGPNSPMVANGASSGPG